MKPEIQTQSKQETLRGLVNTISMKSVALILFFTQLNTLATLSIDGNQTDHLALLSFKAMIKSDPQSAFRSWNDSTHFCNWEGITCGRKHKRVTVLDLQSKSLVGSLTPHIGNMSFLMEIRLQNNTFQGHVPQELGRLFRLQLLRLENNSFQGEIPSNLSLCSNLVFFRIGHNNLVGKIPITLTTLSNLIRLSLQGNHLIGGIPPAIGNLSFLEVLAIDDNPLSGSIPDSIGQLEHLAFVGFHNNNLSGIIPSSIYNLSSLAFVYMSNNSLRGNLPSNLGLLLPNLLEFQLWGNHFTGSIPRSLSNASKLESLDLGANNFTGKVSVNFGALQRLYTLGLYGNNLGSKEGDDLNFLTYLLNCSNLVSFQISSNQLGGVLPNSIANVSSSLKLLSIGQNLIYGDLPVWLTSLVSLSAIGIQFNQITGAIPEDFGKLQKLQTVYFDHNGLSGIIPSSLGNLSWVSWLHLNDNNLRGSVPSSLGNCHNLLFVDFSQNNLNGSLSNQLFASSNMLVSFDLSQNHLVGSIPSEIGKLRNLNELILSQNKLSGNITDGIGQCHSLEYLSLEDNSFEGTIPKSFESLAGLRRLDLSKNNLSGEIPKYFGNFELEYLNLSCNNFEGEVPSGGAFENVSAIFIEGNNQLCGGIPELKLPRCTKSTRNSSLVKILAVVTSFVAVLVVIMSVLLRNRFRRKKTEQSPYPGPLPVMPLQEISYNMILKATNGFSSENLIGVGSFGSVYRAILEEDGAVLAVKVLNLQRRGASNSFMAECNALKDIRHRNLVKIVTSCSSVDFQGNDFKALVYEYMPKGSLEEWLHPNSKTDAMQIEKRGLSLLQRLDIAIDVANALDYLHHHSHQPIVHCDLKPSNILLDNDMVAHIGDFGLAKFLTQLEDHDQSSSVALRGTIGYAAPEYGLGSEVSSSGDVYSYGILLLEMITGKRPTNEIFVEGNNLNKMGRMALPDKVLEIVDPVLLQVDDEAEEQNNNQSLIQAKINASVECLTLMMKIGVACSMESPQDRMDITNALNDLISIRKKLHAK